MDGWQEGRPALKNLIPLIIPRGCLLEQVEEEEDPRWNRLTQAHLEKQPLNGSTVVVVVVLVVSELWISLLTCTR